MASFAPSYEYLLAHFRACRGLYILGAGASAGVAPFGHAFMTGPARDYALNSPSFPVDVPDHAPLTKRIVEMTSGQIIGPGTDLLWFEKVQRLGDYYARLFMKHELAKPRFRQRPIENYRVFRFFYPSLILNYNHDGLAGDVCGGIHRVVDAHGTIQRGYGAPEMGELMMEAREYDLQVTPDDILMCVPETYTDLQLAGRLLAIARFSPRFIAIIGYSFGQRPEGTYDDCVSLDFFREAFRGFLGNVYVISLNPDDLRETLADGIKSKNVLGVPAYWNVLAHAFMKALRDPNGPRSLNYVCEKILDAYENGIVFPRSNGATAE
jgi:hypothetical protein